MSLQRIFGFRRSATGGVSWKAYQGLRTTHVRCSKRPRRDTSPRYSPRRPRSLSAINPPVGPYGRSMTDDGSGSPPNDNCLPESVGAAYFSSPAGSASFLTTKISSAPVATPQEMRTKASSNVWVESPGNTPLMPGSHEPPSAASGNSSLLPSLRMMRVGRPRCARVTVVIAG
jgi:hypothetical protein